MDGRDSIAQQDVLVFDAAAIRAATPWLALISALQEGFRSKITVPQRHHHSFPGDPENTLLLMPA